ncbi:MAG: molybdopterin cofactor-binding domain-containing protein, partial [Pseudomonadales bacterium]
YEKGNLDEGFKNATVIVEKEFQTATVHQGYIEPHNATALWNLDGHLTVWTSTQGAFMVRDQLSDLLDRQELRQLAQRITARYHLTSLNRPDSYAYVMHRLSRAGGNPHLFSPTALRRLYSLSRGIPRVINVIAYRSLLGAYVEGNQQITARIVSRAAREVLGKRANHRRWLVTTAATVTIAGAAWAFLGTNPDPFGIRVGAISDSSMPSAMIEEQPAVEIAEAVELPPEIPDRAVASTVRSSADTPNIEPIDDEIITPETYALNQKLRAAVEAEPSNGGIDSDEVRRPSGSAYLNRRLAYRAVFERWGVDFETLPNAPIPCDFAPSAGLQCLSRRGDWSEIVQLDLPVILELWDGEPAPFYAALTGLKDGSVELQIADRKLSTTQRSLREFWSGGFVVLWQTPPGYYGSLREGQTHETIGWLRQQLATMTQRSLASSAPNHFDENLHEAVMKFQESEGLATDGVVGPATWIRLAERLQLPQPSLAG